MASQRTEERETELKGKSCVVRHYKFGQFGKQVCAEMPATICYAVHSRKRGTLLGYIVDYGVLGNHAGFASKEDVILTS